MLEEDSNPFHPKMPQELSFVNSKLMSPNKNVRGLKALVAICNDHASSDSAISEEVINDHELAHRKAEEAGINLYFIALTFGLFCSSQSMKSSFDFPFSFSN